MTVIDMRIKQAYTGIHKAIHNEEVTSIILHSRTYPVKLAPNGCRCIDYDGFMFMAQSLKSKSAYADAARKGARITWGMTSRGHWIYLDDAVVAAFEERAAKALASLEGNS